jgi:xylulokinase
MTRDLLLGVDVGTTQTKVGVFDLEGRLVASARAGYPLFTDPMTNAAEQDPEDWWEAAARAIGVVTGKVDPARLVAMSVGGQGPTVVALDHDLQPVCRALTWMDLRATAEAQRLSQRAGRNLPSYFFMPKTLWLKNNLPGVYSAARAFCQAWDFIAARLIGELAVSSSPGIAPWNGDLIAAGGLDPAKFPPLRRMGERLGHVTAGATRATGLPEGLPVIGGISDFFEGLIGSGALNRGIACDNGGTSQGFSVCWDAPLDGQGLLKFPSFVEGQWYIGGPVSTTGKALDWWLSAILGCPPDDFSALEGVAAIPAGSERLIFLPYLAGERAPIWDPQARGMFFGLSLGHRREHLTRAVLEAVAYALCHLVERFEAAGGEVLEIRACGGQAKSEMWCRLKADATGRRVVVPEITEAPVLGAAIIAGVGGSAFGTFADGARQMARPRAAIEPDEATHVQYSALFSIYRDLYLQVRPLYDRLSGIT